MADNTINPAGTTAQPSTGLLQNQSLTNQNQSAENVLKKYTPSETVGQEIMGDKLAKINLASKEKAVQENAAKMGMNYVDIATTPINPDLLKIIPAEVAEANFIFPFYRLGKKLRITVAHPTNIGTIAVINDLKQKGYLINTNLSSEEGIKEAVKIYHSGQYVVAKVIETRLDESKLKAYEQELLELKNFGERLKGITAEEAVYMICIGGVKSGVSDIHLESEEGIVRARFRIDGLLHEVFTIDLETFINIASQIKYQSKMRVNVSDVPQDGRFSFVVNQRTLDVRVSALPTEYGESFVFRILDSTRKLLSFEELGFSGQYLDKINHLTELSHGMILVTGPTGSGKSTTLYAMLSRFNRPEVKIITLEDPIEYHLKGVVQSQINEKHGYNFATGLRSILRQDPEVIMLGEIRDLETAETAAQAALTGHVMLSTLHTNSAIETIPRLINIGLPPFMVAPSLHSIIAQRLARRICPVCSVKKPVPAAMREELEKVLESIHRVRPSEKYEVPAELPVIVGCEECSHTGYKGQVILVEMMDVDYEIKDLILNKASTTKMIESARAKGMITIREDGIIKVIQGVTTLEEVHRSSNII